MAKVKVMFKEEPDDGLPRIDKLKLGETEKGKTIQMSRTNLGFWELQFKEGGELPKELQGMFTDYYEASNAVNIYLAKNGKSAS